MKIVSFNVNSVRMRIHQLQALTDQYAPDIIGLQETKVQDHEFPLADIEAMGYNAIYMGQKPITRRPVVQKRHQAQCLTIRLENRYRRRAKAHDYRRL